MDGFHNSGLQIKTDEGLQPHLGNSQFSTDNSLTKILREILQEFLLLSEFKILVISGICRNFFVIRAIWESFSHNFVVGRWKLMKDRR